MLKDLLEEEIEEFKGFHEHRIIQLNFLIEGIINNEKRVLLELSDCKMQRWLYEREDLLVKIYGSENMNELRNLHNDWHTEFTKICDLLLIGDNIKLSIFQKITGKDIKTIYEEEKDKIYIYIKEIEDINLLINKKLQMMSKRLSAMQNRTFNEFL